jgi:hypothetical protein
MARIDANPVFSLSLASTVISSARSSVPPVSRTSSASVVFPIFPGGPMQTVPYGPTSLAYPVFGPPIFTQSSSFPTVFWSMPLVTPQQSQVLSIPVSQQGTSNTQVGSVGVTTLQSIIFPNLNPSIPFPYSPIPSHFLYQPFKGQSLPMTPYTPPPMPVFSQNW